MLLSNLFDDQADLTGRSISGLSRARRRRPRPPSADDNRPTRRSRRRPFGGRGIRAPQAAVADPRSDAEMGTDRHFVSRTDTAFSRVFGQDALPSCSSRAIRHPGIRSVHNRKKRKDRRLHYSDRADGGGACNIRRGALVHVIKVCSLYACIPNERRLIDGGRYVHRLRNGGSQPRKRAG
jgi:hypothetical protein